MVSCRIMYAPCHASMRVSRLLEGVSCHVYVHVTPRHATSCATCARYGDLPCHVMLRHVSRRDIILDPPFDVSVHGGARSRAARARRSPPFDARAGMAPYDDMGDVGRSSPPMRWVGLMSYDVV